MARYPAATAIIVYEVTGTWRRTSKDLDYISIDPTDRAVEDSVSRACWLRFVATYLIHRGVGRSWAHTGTRPAADGT